MSALLEIDQYFVDEFSLEVNRKFGGEECQFGLEIDFDIGRASDGGPRFEVQLRVDVNKEEVDFDTCPYRIHLLLTGYFHFPEDTPEEKINNMIAPNGLSILYGIARSTVSQVVGVGRHGRILLPSVNFIDVIQDKAKREKATKVKKPKAVRTKH